MGEKIWETDSKQTVSYKTPEVTWKLLEQWKGKPVVLNFENLFVIPPCWLKPVGCFLFTGVLL
ncbi:hypothetical protein [Paenibacillus sp. EKM212P]|uniref:hypothetical protein n=1 Tax=Paenibacillus sp. EKM212P TaxID=1683680 RepID=UPI001EECA6BA|nr:hypothetical protein [Paenibacillus sp. EKM212P]